jgi:hypothetical protein
MATTLNLTADEIKEAQGGNFQPLEAGTYGAVIFSSTQKKSKAGNQMFEIDFKLTEGQGIKPGSKRKQRGWFVLSGKGLFKLIELNKATGFPYPKSAEDAGEFAFPDADEYLGIEVLVKIGVEPYESLEEDEDPESATFGEEIEVTRYRNTLDKVLKYDQSKIDGGDGEAIDSGVFLK